jgi:hypothetical protein
VDWASESKRLIDATSQDYKPPAGSKIYLVCFHLPVYIRKVRHVTTPHAL